MYGQAWAAFQTNDAKMAEQVAGQLATESGPFKVKAMFLYADALFVQSQYARAKVIYQKLCTELHGDQRTIATKKIAACNKELNLPEDSGID
jgi:cytochrome c-type biogenesis protein CcmH/NrfG